jgi:hypothetical protein
MALINFGGMKKFYTVMAKCRNCGHIFELKVTKGVTVQEFFEAGQATCTNCGCAQLNIKSNPPTPVQHKTKPLPKQVNYGW